MFMKQFNSVKKVLLSALMCSGVGMVNAQVAHPLAYTSPNSNSYADYVGLRLEVTAPAAIIGDKVYTRANDGLATTTSNWGGLVTSPLINVPVMMGTGADTCGCTAFGTGAMAGKIALIWRGPVSAPCEFGVKALNAQNAGAVACVIMNEYPGQGPIGMAAGTSGASVTIPVFMIGYADGQAMVAQYNTLPAGSVTMTITRWGLNNNNDLGFVPHGFANYHDYAIPKTQITSSPTPNAYMAQNGAFIANYGFHDATNVMLTSASTFTPTSGTPVTFHHDTVATETFHHSDSIWAFYCPTYNLASNITGTGRVDVTYTISSDSVEDYAPDNTATSTFYVTDSLYSKGRYDFANNAPIAATFRAPGALVAGDPFMWGPMYFVAAGGSYFQNVQWRMASNTDTSGPISSLTQTQVFIFKWVDGDNTILTGNVPDSMVEAGELQLVGSAFKSFVALNPADTSGGIFTAAVVDSNGNPANVAMDANSWYFIAPELLSGWFLGCDGLYNSFPRVYGRYNFNNQKEPAAQLWSGGRSDGSTPMIGNFNLFMPTVPSGGASTIDSTVFGNQYLITPAVTVLSTTHPAPLVSVSGTAPQSFNKMQLYPNPANNYVNVAVDFGSNMKNVTYTVIDASARIVSQESHSNVQAETYNFSTSKLATGQYFMVVVADGKQMFRKFTVIK